MRATFIMRRLFLQNCGIFGLLFALLGGCSSLHNVSIVSHGEEEEIAVKPVDSSPSPPVVSVPETKSDSSSPVVSEPVTPLPVNPPVGSVIATQSAEDSILPQTLEDVFFDYDQYTIRRDAVSALEQNAKVLMKRYSKREILIEGHCDERGTQSYNYVLGEKRATMVQQYLVFLGVPLEQLQVASFGKDRPACRTMTTDCFEQNRRAHFKESVNMVSQQPEAITR